MAAMSYLLPRCLRMTGASLSGSISVSAESSGSRIWNGASRVSCILGSVWRSFARWFCC